MTPSPSTVVLGGVGLEYRWSGPGPGEAPAIVMLHEGLGSVALWKDVPDRLAELTGCGVLAYSRHGYGASDPRDGPRRIDYHEREAALLPALLAQFAIEPPFFLFGHSDGASIALIYAGSVPPPAGLILETPHVFLEEVTIRGIEHAKNLYETSDLKAQLARYHDDPEAVFRSWSEAWLSPAFRPWNIERFLPAVACPALLIQCEHDPYGTRAQLDAIARQISGRAEILLLPGDSHAPHHAHPETVLAAAARFVADALRPPS